VRASTASVFTRAAAIAFVCRGWARWSSIPSASSTSASHSQPKAASVPLEVDRDFFLDFHERPGGPARAHEVRLQGGDCTTEIFA
jgi:hypothetical protein